MKNYVFFAANGGWFEYDESELSDYFAKNGVQCTFNALESMQDIWKKNGLADCEQFPVSLVIC